MKTEEKNAKKIEPSISQSINIQTLADDFTSDVMSQYYGKRFDDCEDLEEDPEMDNDWEYLNAEFYNIIYHYFYEMH